MNSYFFHSLLIEKCHMNGRDILAFNNTCNYILNYSTFAAMIFAFSSSCHPNGIPE